MSPVVKKTLEPKGTRNEGFEPGKLMSRTMVVPWSEPSLDQRLALARPSEAKKYRRPAYATSPEGKELELPGQISRTSTVPLTVPSVRHSSTPLFPSFAEK